MVKDETDVFLLNRIRNKDENALGDLIEKYGNYTYSIIYNLLRNSCTHEDMEEALADVYVSIWEHCEQIDLSRYYSIKGYIGAVARNKAKNLLRRRQGDTLPLVDDILSISDIIEHEFLEKEQRLAIQEALSRLSQADQVIFKKYYYDYKKISQIADELDMNEQTVKSRLSRGRKVLKVILEEYERGNG